MVREEGSSDVREAGLMSLAVSGVFVFKIVCGVFTSVLAFTMLLLYGIRMKAVDFREES